MNTATFENNRWSTKGQTIEFRHRAALSLLKKSAVRRANIPILDLGSGDGLFLRLLRENGFDATGVDISEVAAKRCRKDGLAVVTCDFSSAPLPFSNGSFDYVLALDVLEHLYEPQAVLAEMARVSTGGVIIAVPNFSSLPARIQALLGRVPENNTPHKGHIYWFNWGVLSALLKKNGFVVTRRLVNAPWEKILLVSSCMRALARLWPSMFALSFVVMCTPAHLAKKS